MSVKKVFFLLNMKFCFFKWVFLLFFERAHVNAFLSLNYFKSDNKLRHRLLIGRLKNSEENSCFRLVDGNNSEDFFYFLHCFSTD
jgi:hypothetical protein